MTIVYPESEGTPDTPEDPLEVIGFEEVDVPFEHPGRARTAVGVTFALSRPASAREALLVGRQHGWHWRMFEGEARLHVESVHTRDIAASVKLVKERLAGISQEARQLDLRDAETLREVTEKLRAELPEV